MSDTASNTASRPGIVLRPDRAASSSGKPAGRSRRVALTGLLSGDGFLNSQAVAADGASKFVNPLAPKPPHFAPKAKSVIFLFMYGGPSHIDTFDYKPKLYGLDGKTIPVKTKGRGGKKNEGRVVGPKWTFKQYGQSGQWVSRPVPAPGHLRRRHRVHQVDDGRLADPRLGDVADELRARSSAAARASARGSTTAWEA